MKTRINQPVLRDRLNPKPNKTMGNTKTSRETKGTELTLSFNCKGYNLFFKGEIGCVYIDVYFLGDKDPFTVINCWDHANKQSNVISLLAFTDRIAEFVDHNADDLPDYFYNS